MGFTPLEGLVMGTRSGDLDASIVDFIATKEGLSSNQVETLLNKQSGLLGISGLTDDMRDLLAEAAGARRSSSASGDRDLLLPRAEIYWELSGGNERRRGDRVYGWNR